MWRYDEISDKSIKIKFFENYDVEWKRIAKTDENNNQSVRRSHQPTKLEVRLKHFEENCQISTNFSIHLYSEMGSLNR